MGLKENFINDLENLFFDTDNFFNETVTYRSLNEDGTYTETEIVAVITRGQEFFYDDSDGGEVYPAQITVQKSDVSSPKQYDEVVDESGETWVFSHIAGEDRGSYKYVAHSKAKIRFTR